MREFQWQVPRDPSDLVYFRQRMGEAGGQRLLKVSAQLPGDTTVQEKNIMYPTDTSWPTRLSAAAGSWRTGTG
jgi:hypothetical protein